MEDGCAGDGRGPVAFGEAVFFCPCEAVGEVFLVLFEDVDGEGGLVLFEEGVGFVAVVDDDGDEGWGGGDGDEGGDGEAVCFGGGFDGDDGDSCGEVAHGIAEGFGCD